MSTPRDPSSGISDEKLIERTGHPWSHWKQVLDGYDCRAKGHTAAARFLQDEHGVSPWYAQSITVRYETESGIRVPNQRPDGFQFSVSRRLNAPVSEIWAALTLPGMLKRWMGPNASLEAAPGGRFHGVLDGSGIVKAVIFEKGLRLEWRADEAGPPSRVEFNLQRQEERVGLRVTHSRLAAEHDVDRLRAEWREALNELQSLLEGE